jgi:diguanylate cyclase (GGDEF)-like protein
MIQEACNIMDSNFIKVNILKGIRSIQDTMNERNIECCAAYDEENLVGIVTKKELIGVHPNRIVADVMTEKYVCVNYATSIWHIKEIFDCNIDMNIVLVEEKNQVKGFVMKTALAIELGKHVDLLTGLYKSHYIYYNAYNLIKSNQEMSFIFMDVNGFGNIDKMYGHVFGDRILNSIAQILKNNVPEDTYLCRYAGDEFAILAPYPIKKSEQLAEHLIYLINAYEFPHNISVSVSIGISGSKMYNEKAKNIVDIIHKLINTASLASTKAKENKYYPIIIEDVDSNAIA